MAGRRAVRDVMSRGQWAERIAAVDAPRERRAGSPISVERIVAAGLDAIAASGFDALTMRSLAAALGTGPASLYAHVRSKAELGDLLIGELSSRVRVPVPDPDRWAEQFLDVCTQVRDQFLRYPGITRAALAVVPAELATLRVSEGMLAILLAGGAAVQQAAWVCDAAILYITAYCLEAGIAQLHGADREGRTVSRREIADRLRMLPPDHFPLTVAHADELTEGGGHARFDFAIRLMLTGLARS